LSGDIALIAGAAQGAKMILQGETIAKVTATSSTAAFATALANKDLLNEEAAFITAIVTAATGIDPVAVGK
jgi:hypothetical protein